MKNADNSYYEKGSRHLQPPNQCCSLSAKINGCKGGHLLHVLRHAKGTSLAETTLNSEKIKAVALTIIEYIC